MTCLKLQDNANKNLQQIYENIIRDIDVNKLYSWPTCTMYKFMQESVTNCFGSINERLSIVTQGKKTKKQEEIIKR